MVSNARGNRCSDNRSGQSRLNSDRNYHRPIVRPGSSNSSSRVPKKFSYKLFPFWRGGYSLNKFQLCLVILGLGLVLTGGYMSLVGWRSNHAAQVQAEKLIQQANTSGSSKQNQTPATKPPSPEEIADYVVAPNLPRYLLIPKLGVDARIFSVGLTSDGALGTPNNVYDTDWYNESAEPGQPGAMLIDGHISSWTAHGVFYGIKNLVPGDLIRVERGDGTIFSYDVVKTQIYNANDVNMQAAITPIVAGKPGLNLISCTGDVISGTSQFNERIIVFAEQVT